MKNIEIKFFGPIDITKLSSYYDIVGVLNDDKEIDLDLNFENEFISEAQAKSINDFLDKLLVYDEQNRIDIAKNFKDEGEASDYVNFYFEELFEEELEEIIDFENKERSKEEQLLDKLRLIRVGLYPDSESYFGVFDYSIYINGEACNQLLVIIRDKRGGLHDLTWES